MPLSSFEVAMQTMASVFSDYLEGENNSPRITDDGLKKLVKEQFPHCKTEEISPGVFYIAIPLRGGPFLMSEKELRAASENIIGPHKVNLGSSMLPEGSICQMANEEVTNLQKEGVSSRCVFITPTVSREDFLTTTVEVSVTVSGPSFVAVKITNTV